MRGWPTSRKTSNSCFTEPVAGARSAPHDSLPRPAISPESSAAFETGNPRVSRLSKRWIDRPLARSARSPSRWLRKQVAKRRFSDRRFFYVRPKSSCGWHGIQAARSSSPKLVALQFPPEPIRSSSYSERLGSASLSTRTVGPVRVLLGPASTFCRSLIGLDIRMMARVAGRSDRMSE